MEGFGGQVVEMVGLRVVGSLSLSLRNCRPEIELLRCLILLLELAFLLRSDCLVEGVEGGREGVDDILCFWFLGSFGGVEEGGEGFGCGSGWYHLRNGNGTVLGEEGSYMDIWRMQISHRWWRTSPG